MVTLQSEITVLPGVGSVRAKALSMLDIYTVEDLLLHFPRAYQNRGDTQTIMEAARSGEKCAMILTVGSEPRSVQLKNRKTLTTFTLFDDTGKITSLWFNQTFIRQVFHIGSTFRFWGKVTRGNRGWEISSPEFEPVNRLRPLPDLFPIYPLTAGINQKFLQNLVALALSSLDAPPEEIIPERIREKQGLCSRAEAFAKIHRPDSFAELAEARNYFIFEELYEFALGIAGAKRERRRLVAPRFIATAQMREKFRKNLPFTLTSGQEEAIADVERDLASGLAMRRLISGDVGSGKTVCAAAAVYIAAENGYRSALMAPTEILARQHYADLTKLFRPLGIRVGLLVGSLTAAAKRKVKAEAVAGAIDLLVGTHALLSEGVELPRCGLIITDEQHRFGIAQRNALAGITDGVVHNLVMSATPIPRTLALVLYGDLDVSSIRTMPPGRKKVSTFLVDDTYRTRMEGFIEKQAAEGHQTYIVCPAIEARDEEDEGALVGIDGHKMDRSPLHNAVEYAESLAARHPNLKIGVLHGKMKGADKDKIMARYVSGEVQVLVSTTVIEVGINVPASTLMIVENAERFGLSQLHQLRGRVGRGDAKSWCILVSDTENEDAKARLNALCDTADGYEIAEFDLKQRGPGDFFPSVGEGAPSGRQHGQLRFRLASLCDDMNLLQAAFAAAEETLGGEC
ncbi:MAG: ATP-dependent DNA helicase RecG [Clostridia bacterium]|nr:ATP-dependent DNA helicase RecG [Clostridia bacterium]